MHLTVTVLGKGLVLRVTEYFVVETGKNNGVNRDRDYPQLLTRVFAQHLYIIHILLGFLFSFQCLWNR